MKSVPTASTTDPIAASGKSGPDGYTHLCWRDLSDILLKWCRHPLCRTRSSTVLQLHKLALNNGLGFESICSSPTVFSFPAIRCLPILAKENRVQHRKKNRNRAFTYHRSITEKYLSLLFMKVLLFQRLYFFIATPSSS